MPWHFTEKKNLYGYLIFEMMLNLISNQKNAHQYPNEYLPEK